MIDKKWLASRQKEVKALATSLGLDYEQGNSWKLIQRLGAFDLFKNGFESEVCNVITTQPKAGNAKVYLFDYKYELDKLELDVSDFEVEEGRDYHRQTVFCVVAPHLNLPNLDIRPENFWDKIRAFFGWKDINFVTNAHFSRTYHVASDDEKRLTLMVSDEFMDMLDNEKNWHLEGDGGTFILFKKDELIPVGKLQEFLHFGISLYESLKERD